LEEQFDAFLSRLELLESEEYSSVAEDDDVDALARERILNIKLPNSAFEPLLAHLTPSRAPLHQALMQQSLISGQHQKVKKKSKSDRKDKKRRDKERDREKESRSQDYGKVKSRKDKQFQNPDFYNSQSIGPIQLAGSREKYQDVIAKENSERQNAADILADIITDTEKLGKTEMEIFLIDLKKTNLHSDEYQKIVDAKTEQLQLEKDISKESELQKQIQEWNTEDLKKGQEIADAAAKNLEQANRSNAMPGVESLATAIGSVKVAGSADFSKQTELLNSAKKANDIASEQLKALRQIVDNSGGTA
jgi:hypothetical protein